MKALVRMMAVAAMTVGVSSAMQAQALPAASDIVAKYITAIGGREAVLKVKSISQTATMEVPAAGVTADVEIAAAAPNMLAMKSTIPGIGEMLQGFNGTVGWNVDPMQGPRLMTPKEVEQAKESNDLHASRLFPAELYTKMEVLEQVDFNGEKAHKVRMTMKSGNVVTHYFSTTTNLLIGSDVTQESPNGTQTMQMKFSEYKEQDGYKFPTRTEMSLGPLSIITTIKATTFNTVPATAFEVPAAIKPLIAK